MAKPNLTWWEKERRDMQNELNELLGDLGKMRAASKRVRAKPLRDTLVHAFSIKQKQIEELRKKLKI